VADVLGGGFSFNGHGLSVSAGLPDGWSSSVVNDCTPCTVDEARTLSFSSSCVGCVSSGSSGTELGGVVYSSPVTFGANFDFHGPTFSSTDLSANHLTFMAPFTMTGHLDAYTSPFDVNPPFYSTGRQRHRHDPVLDSGEVFLGREHHLRLQRQRSRGDAGAGLDAASRHRTRSGVAVTPAPPGALSRARRQRHSLVVAAHRITGRTHPP
jgi:hypothetical protein